MADEGAAELDTDGLKKKQKRPAHKARRKPLIPQRAAEDRPEAWGESGAGAKSDEEYEQERPPHW